MKENSIVAMNDNDDEPQWRRHDPLTLNLFQLSDGADVAVRVISTDDGAANFRCRRVRNKLTIESDGKAKRVSAYTFARCAVRARSQTASRAKFEMDSL